MKNKFPYILTYAIAHFLIDTTCAGVLLSQYNNLININAFVLALIIYNVLAFGSQPIFGAITDKYKNPVFMAILGSLIVASSAFMMNNLFLSAIVAGVGNAIFHIGGGVINLRMANGRATIPGLFVAPGAIGIFIGGYLGKNNIFNPYLFLVLLLISCILMYFLNEPSEFKKKIFSCKTSHFYVMASLILFSILMRAFIGKGIYVDWKLNLHYGALLTGCVFMGKALGGIISDYIGWKKVAIGGLLISAPMLSFFIENPVIFCFGVLFFNMTMPVTLIALANIMPNRHGLAFGLTTLSLIIGTLPALIGFRFINEYLILGLVFLSAFVLYYALKLYEGKKI